MVAKKKVKTAPLKPDIRAMLTAVSDAVVLLDENELITFANREASNLIGFSEEEVCGTPLWEACKFLIQKTRKPLSEHVYDGVTDDGSLTFPIATILISADGTERIVRGNVYLSLNDKTDRRTIRSVVFRDVSSRWQIDKVSLRVQRFGVLKALAEGVAHNLDDLLTVLLARMSRIRRSQNDRNVVLLSIKEAEEVIDKISSLVSCLSTGQLGADSKEGIALVANVLKSATGTLSALFPDIELSFAYPDRTGYAGVPPDLLEQVVMNLLLNAAEASGGNGSVNLTSCRIELEEDMEQIPAGNYVMISVVDNGCGISESDLIPIFDPFFSTKGKGRGLGLSAVYSIVHSFQGHYIVNSQQDKGSAFTVFLPVADRITIETANDVIPSIAIGGYIGMDTDILVTIFKSLGCSVFDMTTSYSDMELLSTVGSDDRFNLLVIDSKLLSPEEVISLDSIPSDKAVIVVTSSDEDVSEISGSNIVFLKKPFGIDTVCEALGKCVWSRDFSKQTGSGNGI
ncbi:MAG: PAS domain S-box protein [Candidatus Aegiribacteria sp.]|nr:PAS domain S-box protein [Candidatus Aegiribacteria sp.]